MDNSYYPSINDNVHNKGKSGMERNNIDIIFGVAFLLFYEFKQYEAKPFKQVGIVFLIIGIALLIWFGITG